ncbi:MAG: flagellar motor switch protein FliN [Burkholderiaceae bacterium]|nr:flagellar motor switch protein FliN [Burkholderiaceae bacterium]
MTTDNPHAAANAVDDEWAAALAEQNGSAAAHAASASASAGVTTVESAGDASQLFPRLSGTTSDARNDIDMILDIPVQLTVELGRTRIPIKHILQLAQGSVIELDALAGEPMDVLVNGCLIAQGEVVVVNDKFGIRLTDIVTPNERVRRINRG